MMWNNQNLFPKSLLYPEVWIAGIPWTEKVQGRLNHNMIYEFQQTHRPRKKFLTLKLACEIMAEEERRTFCNQSIWLLWDMGQAKSEEERGQRHKCVLRALTEASPTEKWSFWQLCVIHHRPQADQQGASSRWEQKLTDTCSVPDNVWTGWGSKSGSDLVW